MDSLAPRGGGAQPAPGRHGTCQLRIHINGCEYAIKRIRPTCKGGRAWRLRKLSGPRTGAVYTITRAGGFNRCTCPDFARNKFSCKHVNSLVASRLLSGRKLPDSKYRDIDTIARDTLASRPAPATLPTTVPEEIRSPSARRTAAAILARAALLNGSRPEGGAE